MSASGGTGTTKATLPAPLRYLMLFGDSKTAGKTWPEVLRAGISTDVAPWSYSNGAVAGTTVASYLANNFTAMLAGMPDATDAPTMRVLINFGANDVSAVPSEAKWTTDYLTLIDTVHAKWPVALIYIMRPWRRGFLAGCNTLAQRIDLIAAARPTFVFPGADERVWFEGGDDAVSRSDDGVHYNVLGLATCAAAWKTVLGL